MSEELVEGPLVYADCGARGARGNRLVRAFARSEYLGFEPDSEECARLTAAGKKRRRYFPVAAGKAREMRRFHVTRSAACSSLLRPNDRLAYRFLGFAPLFEVVDELDIATVALDEYLPSQGGKQSMCWNWTRRAANWRSCVGPTRSSGTASWPCKWKSSSHRPTAVRRD